MKPDFLYEDEDRLADYAQERRLGAPAGIFLLDGGFHVANHGSRAALKLLDRGALLVANLLFDPRSAEREVSGGAPAPRGASFVDVSPLHARGTVAQGPKIGRN
ncbi:MAG TPA: hypothetical protein VHG91_11645 [Longimicrobium sp.]|nr:hypothetical protein [Longimicrobium sp.]